MKLSAHTIEEKINKTITYPLNICPYLKLEVSILIMIQSPMFNIRKWSRSRAFFQCKPITRLSHLAGTESGACARLTERDFEAEIQEREKKMWILCIYFFI